MSDRRLWTTQEDAIICQLVKEHGCKKWTVIAQEMCKICGKEARTSKQIRQRWYNHLDPEINKCSWTEQEERLIFEAHKIYGSKWKEIAKLLHARTDNSVKNHFYSTLRRSLRRINKYLGYKNSTNQMRVLKPSILSQLVESSDQQAKLLVARIFEFASFKPNKNNTTKQGSSNLGDQQKSKYQAAIEKLVEFNNLYEQDKRNSLKVLRGRSKKKEKINIQAIYKSPKSKSTINTVKIEEQSDLEQAEAANQGQQPLSNQSTVSDRDLASWEDIKSEQNGMLPELQHPQKQFNFFEAQEPNLLLPLINPYGAFLGDDRRNFLWFEAGHLLQTRPMKHVAEY